MNDRARIFFGITMGLLIGLIVLFLPIPDMRPGHPGWKAIILLGCIIVTASIYNKNRD